MRLYEEVLVSEGACVKLGGVVEFFVCHGDLRSALLHEDQFPPDEFVLKFSFVSQRARFCCLVGGVGRIVVQGNAPPARLART